MDELRWWIRTKVAVRALLVAAALLVAFMLTGGTPAAGDSDLLALINAYRVENGLGALAVQPKLAAAAQWKAQDLESTGVMSHTDSLGRDAFERMDTFGYEGPPLHSRGEVLSRGLPLADVMAEWKASLTHNAALLQYRYTEVGIGQAGIYFAVDLGGWWLEPVELEPAFTFPTTLPRTGGQ